LLRRRIGLIRGNQGPWHDLEALLNSSLWQELSTRYADESGVLEKISTLEPGALLNDDRLSLNQKLNLLQILYGQARWDAPDNGPVELSSVGRAP
jgi:hypothetical protein